MPALEESNRQPGEAKGEESIGFLALARFYAPHRVGKLIVSLSPGEMIRATAGFFPALTILL